MDQQNVQHFQSLRAVPEVQVIDDFEERVFMQTDLRMTNMESHIFPHVDRVSIEEWIILQQKLKEEKYKILQEYNIKQQLLEELNKESQLYYQTYINVLEENNFTLGEKKISESLSRLFGNASTYVQILFQNLCNNPGVCSAILHHHNNIALSKNIESLVNTIIHNFFDNIACESMWKQPIMRLMSDMIRNEINRYESPDFRWDRDDSLAQFVINEFSKRPENVKYAKVIYKNSLIQITKVDKFLDLDKLRIANKLREIKKLQKEKEERHNHLIKPMAISSVHQQMTRSQSAMTSRASTLPIFTTPKQNIEMPQANMASYYASLIKSYDQQLKYGKKDNRRNPNQLSEYSLKMLNFNEEQRQAKFISLERRSLGNESISPIRRLSEVYSHSGKSEVQMNNEVNRVLAACIDKLKQLVNNVMDNIFKNIYIMPVGLRLICKIIEINLQRKYKDITEQQIQDNIFSFLFNVWLIPQLRFPKHYQSFKFIREEHEQTVNLIHQIMKKLVRRQNYDEDPIYQKLNQYIQDLQLSLKDYLREILNLCPKSVEDLINYKNQWDGPQSNCACMALSDVKTLCQLLKEMKDFKHNDQSIQDQINKLQNLSSKILNVDDNEKIFYPRIDIGNTQLQPSQIYALILDFQLPKELNLDYLLQIQPLQKLKNIKQEDKLKVKICNGLRQILLEVQDLSISPACSQDDASLRRALTYFEEKYTILGDKKIVQHLKYIKEQINQLTQENIASNLKEYFEYLNSQYEIRLEQTTQQITETKYQLLIAKFNIKKNQEMIKQSLEQLKQERRQKQLYDFIEEKTPLNFCITSPKTREGLYSVKAMKMRNNNTIDETKIWVEDQKDCIHNAINLEFIKQIVGGASPNESKKNQEFSNSHCQNIKEFIEIFASLPEVRESVITGEDKTGVKLAYFEFIRALAEYLGKKDNVNLDSNSIMEMLEKYVSKRIYDKVYPKERTYKDAGLYFRIKSIDWISYDNLEIPKQNRVDGIWMLAVDALLYMDNCKTAVSKLEAMIKCSKIMTDVLKLTSLKDEPASADTTLPIIIYILIKAAPQRLYSNLNFVQLFLDQSKTVGQQGYCVTQIQLALQWLEVLNASMLKMDELQFEEFINEQEIKYGIHYLKKRNRSERIIMSVDDVIIK